jgi:sigma-B regulation protein RsbU (phosphoserine phosphatase)
MALIRSLLRHSVTHVDPPSGRWVIGPHGTLEPGSGVDAALLLRAVAATNDYLISNHLRQGYFASLFFAVLNPDTGGIVYANCGHNPPILSRGDGGHSLLEPTGPALGLLPESIFTYGRATLDPGDLLFIYTDGVPDARDAAGEFFTEERMLRLVTTTVGADALLTRIDGEISGHVGTAEPFDDITMIALYRQPDPSESTSPEQPAALPWFNGVPSY